MVSFSINDLLVMTYIELIGYAIIINNRKVYTCLLVDPLKHYINLNVKVLANTPHHQTTSVTWIQPNVNRF